MALNTGAGNDRFIPTAHNDDQNAPPPPADNARAALLRQALPARRARQGAAVALIRDAARHGRAGRARRGSSPKHRRRACATPFRVLAAPD